jgi:hypothetical protein
MKKFKTPEEIALELINVQPMPNDIIKNLKKVSKAKEVLEQNNYKPVSNMKLLWIKDSDSF